MRNIGKRHGSFAGNGTIRKDDFTLGFPQSTTHTYNLSSNFKRYFHWNRVTVKHLQFDRDHEMVVVTYNRDAADDLIQHGSQYTAVNDARITLVALRHGIFTEHLVLAIIVEMQVKPDRVIAAADKAHVRVRLFVQIYNPPLPATATAATATTTGGTATTRT